MKNTIQETVKEVYNTNNNKNSSFRKNVHNFNTNLSSNNAYKKNTNSSNEGSGRVASGLSGLSGLAALETIKSTSSSSHNSGTSILWAFIIVVLVLALIAGLVFVFKEDIKPYVQSFFENEDYTEKVKALESKVDEEVSKRTKLEKKISTIKKNQSSKTKDKSNPTTQSDSSLKQQYSSSSIVSEDGYCYIGTDNNMRQCVKAYAGDICTSGDIYKRMDDCLIPKLEGSSNCTFS
tara:strand:+ start:1002 stop:1706 length:705 start_codon:yes stop_codon:yes gene_type:complete